MSSTSASIQRAGAPTVVERRSRELEHARAEVDADDLVGAQVPERQRVATAGALQVDRAPAPSVQVADELELRREEVRPARRDQLDRLGEPALVALGGLVPGPAVGGVHAADVGRSAGVAGRMCGLGSSAGMRRESTAGQSPR